MKKKTSFLDCIDEKILATGVKYYLGLIEYYNKK